MAIKLKIEKLKWFLDGPLPKLIPTSNQDGCHLGRRSEMPDTILEGDHTRIISAKFGWDWLSSYRGEDFLLNSSPLFSIFSLAAILVGSQDPRTHFWKGAIQGPYHQSLVAIGPVVSEEKIFMWISQWYGPWMAPFQKCVRGSWLPTKMAAKLKIEKRGDEFKRKSSPL
jgi:hypothetical protein